MTVEEADKFIADLEADLDEEEEQGE